MNKLIFATILLIPLLANADKLSNCHQKNITLGNNSLDDSNSEKSKNHFKKSYECAITKKQKITSLVSLAVTNHKAGNTDESVDNLKMILSISPKNNWVNNFANKNIEPTTTSEITSSKEVISDTHKKTKPKPSYNSSYKSSDKYDYANSFRASGEKRNAPLTTNEFIRWNNRQKIKSALSNDSRFSEAYKRLTPSQQRELNTVFGYYGR